MSTYTSHSLRKQRQQEAVERQSESDSRTPQEQLRRLDELFGEEQGASKERTRLNAQIERQSR